MSTAQTLLAQATTVLAEGSPHSNRAACWIARAALESTVDDLLSTQNRVASEATMRSKLTVLEVALQPDEPRVPAVAEYAWSGLSQACHHHAFELTPPAAEVQHLIDLVRELAQTAARSSVDSGASQPGGAGA